MQTDKLDIVKITREQGIMGLLSSLVALLPLLAIIWLVIQPALKNSIGIALADDIKSTVQREVAPIKVGFDVLLTQQILATQKEIALLERKGSTNLSPEETTRLVDLRAQLEAQQHALSALRQ